jgi:hypothetical protein
MLSDTEPRCGFKSRLLRNHRLILGLISQVASAFQLRIYDWVILLRKIPENYFGNFFANFGTE